MGESDMWHVILDHTEHRLEMRHVPGTREDAREVARRIARTHNWTGEGTREIHQVGEDMWFVAFRHTSGLTAHYAAFRVYVSRLVEVLEPAPEEEEPEPRRRGFGRRRR
ncbi:MULTISPECIES: hypothetical protein [unclassified Streptomyces]|uniref:hypothetical protein n=1 Tax=unclassified Streptomyces TaxID=2593676 RepID=UPI001160EC7A|nr:hypothetical protein [Streptomyces sp. CB02058]